MLFVPASLCRHVKIYIHRPLVPPQRGFAIVTEDAENNNFSIAVERTAMEKH
jgi:hypothetical protein